MSKAAKEFNIKRSTVRGFFKSLRKIKENDQDLPHNLSTRKKLFRSRNCKYSEVDERLFEYYRNKRKHNQVVRRKELAKQAELYAKEISIDDFKATQRYITRFLEKYSITLKFLIFFINMIYKD